jgi:hypothetical protein
VNVTPVLTVSQAAKVNELLNPTISLELYNVIHSDLTPTSYEIWLLHHNVQRLSNKLLDIAILLATDHSNLNILFHRTRVVRRSMESFNTFCPRGVYILRGLSSHQSGAL